MVSRILRVLYIFWFLHQTTTDSAFGYFKLCCISFDSYIKPQLRPAYLVFEGVVYLLIPTSNHNTRYVLFLLLIVVYLLIPTSNHNLDSFRMFFAPVVYLLIPTSNHNLYYQNPDSSLLYIFWFLHQTTTVMLTIFFHKGCISFDSYIKPQLWHIQLLCGSVVYLLIPTSNHNSWYCIVRTLKVVYLLIPTSNHNFLNGRVIRVAVVYLLIPTSNHN